MLNDVELTKADELKKNPTSAKKSISSWKVKGKNSTVLQDEEWKCEQEFLADVAAHAAVKTH